MSDRETLNVYAREAQTYADMVETEGVPKDLAAFLARLPAGGRVLDWGCGAGNAAALMTRAGFAVTATDGAAEFAQLVEAQHQIPVRVETFAQMQDVALYDGIWASFSLLHDRKSAMPRNLAAAHRALKPGGALCLGLKVGEGEQRDQIGRFYAYYQPDEITGLLADAVFTVTDMSRGEGIGLDGVLWPWMVLHCDG